MAIPELTVHPATLVLAQNCVPNNGGPLPPVVGEQSTRPSQWSSATRVSNAEITADF